MGISTILAAAARHISWDQLANMAIQYGPDFVRRFRERLQQDPAAETAATETVSQLSERIRELESALIRQEELIELHHKNIGLLEENGRTLLARLNIFMTISAVSAVLSIALFILLLRK